MESLITYFLIIVFLMNGRSINCLLFPRDSETRESKSLDGIWKFRLSPALKPEIGFKEQWYSKKNNWLLQEGNIWDMPVPSSYNDITTQQNVRDFVGWAWYFRTFFTPLSWQDKVRKLKMEM